MNSVFRKARKYSILPMFDEILKTFSRWFNDYRKEAGSVSTAKKLVPLVENIMHDRCQVASKLVVSEVNSYTLEYYVNDRGIHHTVSLSRKSCICNRFDIDKYPCVHAIAAVIALMRCEDRSADIHFHDLCSKYYLMETWLLAYCRSIYSVPHISLWNIPEDVTEIIVKPPNKKENKGRNQETRFPSSQERRRRRRRKKTSNKDRPNQDLGDWTRSQNIDSGDSDGDDDIDGDYDSDSDSDDSDGEPTQEKGV
uniref:SWIM-type domain-containing protein n=1 Tax=Noccaea caerulescens TaxID=107243 RepID=A0A1J3EIR4_NOCCA